MNWSHFLHSFIPSYLFYLVFKILTIRKEINDFPFYNNSFVQVSSVILLNVLHQLFKPMSFWSCSSSVGRLTLVEA